MAFSIVKSILVAIALGQVVLAAPTPTEVSPSQSKKLVANAYLPQASPAFSSLSKPSGVVSSYNYGPYETPSSLSTDTLSGYPDTWKLPNASHPDIQAIIKKIDWTKVPNAPVRTIDASGSISPSTDGPTDPYCYWSDTKCNNPKVSYLPEDYYQCPRKGDWGLSYDDGPFNLYYDENAASENPYAEPALYNFLAKQNNQKATLFYIGSNVINYPAAAKLAFNDGHQICSHTWSHPPMTTVSNEQVVAEFYWSLRAIKEATGVTPKCWRPPQGDVDDRVRSIAWQMGLHTIIWNDDTDDWDMPAPGGGDLPPSEVDKKFSNWIAEEKAGQLNNGLLVLEHELNSATVNMSMHWLPTLQKTFNVIPALACNGVTQPYWETNYVYPLNNQAAKK